MRRVDAFCLVASLLPGAFAAGHGHGSAHEGEHASMTVNMCDSDFGTMQSPINLDLCTKKIKEGGNKGEMYNMPLERAKLEFHYGANKLEVKKVCPTDDKRPGCLVQIAPHSEDPKTNSFSAPGIGSYSLDHCNIRIPSEHTINKNYYPLEVQCVHTMDHSNHRRKGIVSTLYEDVGDSSGFIGSILDHMPIDEKTPGVANMGFGGSTGRAGSTRYYSYRGSQTTHGCKEDVDWFVMYDVTGISQGQMDNLRKNITNWKPARPLQDLLGRHPDGCHLDKGAAASAALSALSLVLAVFSLLARA